MKRSAFMMSGILALALSTVSHVQATDKSPDQMVTEARKSITAVTIAEVKKMIDEKQGFILIDVRDKQEFEEGHIPGAVNISRGTLEFKAAMILPDKSTRIVVYCGVDLRSPLATKAMTDLGYRNAVNMAGGLKLWKEAGYPIVK